LAAVEQLRAEGVLFDFLLVENLSNSEAIKVYEKSDLVIDQLLAGWYGAFAVESMALGKPVICYLRENDLHLIPTKMRDELPIINANPDSIYAVLRDWLKKWHSNYETKEILGRRFAARWHDPVQIAGKLSEDYRRIALKKACR
jgi:glycosyltransferase involved in cell wall biosynthesis